MGRSKIWPPLQDYRWKTEGNNGLWKGRIQNMDRGPWTIQGTWSMGPVHGPPHGPPLIFNRKSPLLMLKYTGGQSINKNTDSYLLLTSLRVCLVIAGCFGIAPHKWEDHELVLRYRRSSAFLPPIFSFQLVNLMGKKECIQFSY